MILLATPSDRACECATALHQATGQKVVIAENLALATTLLRAESYRIAVLDQHLLEATPEEANLMLEHIGTALPVQLNLAISGIDRLVREVRCAIERRLREEAVARRAAAETIYSDVSETLTALLLSTELAIEVPGLPAAAGEKLQSVLESARKLRWQLETGPPSNPPKGDPASESAGYGARPDIS
ncbi:MAG: hypothetical protein ACLPHI_21125 [Terriglobales bacterium]|jgi:hypothetical protein